MSVKTEVVSISQRYGSANPESAPIYVTDPQHCAGSEHCLNPPPLDSISVADPDPSIIKQI